MDQLASINGKKPTVKKPAAKKAVPRKRNPAIPAAKKPVPKTAPKKAKVTTRTIKKPALPKVAKPAQDKAEKNTGFKFPKGNKYWHLRTKTGRNSKWDNPQQLLDDCISYLEWVDKNPLWEEKPFSYQGDIVIANVNVMRAATLNGLQMHIGISDQGWLNYRVKPDFVGVIEYVEKAIYEQKFTGAAANLLNANIISRELGLADKKELTGAGGGPIQSITRQIVQPGQTNDN